MTLNKDIRPSTIAINHPVESKLKADADPAAKLCVPVFLPGKSVPDIFNRLPPCSRLPPGEGRGEGNPQ